MCYKWIRPFLFSLEAEQSHDFTLFLLSALKYLPKISYKSFANPIQILGLSFNHRVGLAAGLDKNAQCIPAWQAMDFSFVEVGTVTPRSQLGNPKPRLFRLPAHHALINRMGFNNKGVDYLVEKLKENKGRTHIPIGVNIGKNKDTSLENAHEDYRICFQKVYHYADYVSVNLSSPNTPGLRSLQHGDQLKAILSPLKQNQIILADKYNKYVPLLVKISPDLEQNEIKELIDALLDLKIDGVIATNTTLTRPSNLSEEKKEEGGLSGKPLFEKSTQIIRTIYQQAGDSLPIIAVGGIFSKEDAQIKLAAGAKLIQIYTGLIYKGPALIKEILKK